MTLHWHKEIDTAGFRKFLKDAQQAFLKFVGQSAGNLEDLMPWKVLGKKWHLSRKGFPTGQRVAWDPSVLEALVEMLEQSLPEAVVDWTGQQTVSVQPQGTTTTWAVVTTKRRAGLDLTLTNPAGKVALGRIAEFGSEREITVGRQGQETVRIRFDAIDQINPDLKAFLKESARTFRDNR